MIIIKLFAGIFAVYLILFTVYCIKFHLRSYLYLHDNTLSPEIRELRKHINKQQNWNAIVITQCIKLIIATTIIYAILRY